MSNDQDYEEGVACNNPSFIPEMEDQPGTSQDDNPSKDSQLSLYSQETMVVDISSSSDEEDSLSRSDEEVLPTYEEAVRGTVRDNNIPVGNRALPPSYDQSFVFGIFGVNRHEEVPPFRPPPYDETMVGYLTVQIQPHPVLEPQPVVRPERYCGQLDLRPERQCTRFTRTDSLRSGIKRYFCNAHVFGAGIFFILFVGAAALLAVFSSRERPINRE